MALSLRGSKTTAGVKINKGDGGEDCGWVQWQAARRRDRNSQPAL